MSNYCLCDSNVRESASQPHEVKNGDDYVANSNKERLKLEILPITSSTNFIDAGTQQENEAALVSKAEMNLVKLGDYPYSISQRRSEESDKIVPVYT